jgi:hypothetical protein
MIGNICCQLENAEPIPAPTYYQQLAQENRTLRAMITELLIKNQNLRWELLAHQPADLREERVETQVSNARPGPPT